MVRPASFRLNNEPSTAELFAQLSDQMSRMVRNEVTLAQREVRAKLAGSTQGVGIALFAAIVGLLGATGVVAFGILALALVLPAWLSALIIGAALLLIAAIAAGAARAKLRTWRAPVPQDALASVGQDISALMSGLRR